MHFPGFHERRLVSTRCGDSRLIGLSPPLIVSTLGISAPAFATPWSAHIWLALARALANLGTAAIAATTFGIAGRLPISRCGLVGKASTTLRTWLLPPRLRPLGRLFTLDRLFTLGRLAAWG